MPDGRYIVIDDKADCEILSEIWFLAPNCCRHVTYGEVRNCTSAGLKRNSLGYRWWFALTFKHFSMESIVGEKRSCCMHNWIGHCY